MANNNNKNKPFRVYRVIIDEVWGVEWRRARYFDTQAEAIAFKERPRQQNLGNAKYVIVHVSKEEAFAQKMNAKLEEWKNYQKKLAERERKLTRIDAPNCGSVRYNTRCSAHGFITGATRLA